MMHHTQRAALAAGRRAHDAGLCVIAANPYQRRTKSHCSFERGFREAHRDAARVAQIERTTP